jgi:hypothetical protein
MRFYHHDIRHVKIIRHRSFNLTIEPGRISVQVAGHIFGLSF